MKSETIKTPDDKQQRMGATRAIQNVRWRTRGRPMLNPSQHKRARTRHLIAPDTSRAAVTREVTPMRLRNGRSHPPPFIDQSLLISTTPQSVAYPFAPSIPFASVPPTCRIFLTLSVRLPHIQQTHADEMSPLTTLPRFAATLICPCPMEESPVAGIESSVAVGQGRWTMARADTSSGHPTSIHPMPSTGTAVRPQGKDA